MEKKSLIIEYTALFISILLFSVSADTTDSADIVNKESSLSDSSAETQKGSVLEEESFFQVQEEPEELEDTAADEEPVHTVDDEAREELKKGDPQRKKEIMKKDEKLITNEEEESFFQVQEEPEELEDTAADKEPVHTVDDETREELKKRDSQREREMMNKGERLRAEENTDKEEEKDEEKFMPSDKIESDASINFAKSVEDYKSPKKAFFMSLVLPGLGQAYTKNITKSVLFGLAEVGLIAAYFGVEKNADNRENSAHSYAKNHFIADSLINYYENLQEFIDMDSAGMSTSDVNSIFSITDSTILSDEELKEDYVKPGSNDFYSIIKNPAYVQGWEDAEPNFTETGFSGEFDEYEIHSDSSWLIKREGEESFTHYGFSDYQDEYKERIGNASNLHDIAKVFLYILIANHVGSSIDAFISAKIYNRRLLKEQSESQAGSTLWENLDIKNRVVFRENGPKAEMELVFRF